MKYCLTFIFLCATFFISVGQTSDRLFNRADSLFSKGDYLAASVEYAHIAYLDPGQTETSIAILKRAWCLKKTGRYSDAVSELYRINTNGLPDSVQFLVRYEAALNAYLIGDFQEAISQFDQMDYFIHDSVINSPSLYLRILTLNELGRWQEAHKYFLEFFSVNNVADNDSSLVVINRMYGEQIPKLKDPDKAGLMSTFMPGLGQLYAGYPGEAVLSFGLNAFFLAGSAWLIYRKYYLTGWLGGLGLLGSFYQGGSRRAVELAKEKNMVRSGNFNRSIRKLLIGMQ